MASKIVGDHYFLQKEIGRGRFSSVWLGTDTSTNQELAFKMLKISKLDSTLQNFLTREIEVMRMVNSPYIVKLQDVLRTTNNVYLVLELCRGGNIGQYLKSKGLIPRHLACRWLSQIVDAFITLSARNIVHRDLKLENVLLTSENEEEAVVKLADFGLTRVLNTDGFILQTKVGTPLYMAPEILAGQVSNTKVDVWSFGVLANYMLGGPLFRGLKTLPQLLSVQENTQNDIAASNLPDDVKELLSCALCYDPAQRLTFQEIRNLRFFTGAPAPMTTGSLRPEPSLTGCASNALSHMDLYSDYYQRILNLNYRLKEELEKVANVGVDFGNRNYGLVVIAVYHIYLSEVDKCIATAMEIQQTYNSPELEQFIYEANLKRANGKKMIEAWQVSLSSFDLSRSIVHFDTKMWVEPRVLKEAADLLIAEAEATNYRIEKLRVALYLLHLGKEDERNRLKGFTQGGLPLQWTPIGNSWDELMEWILAEIKAAEQCQT